MLHKRLTATISAIVLAISLFRKTTRSERRTIAVLAILTLSLIVFAYKTISMGILSHYVGMAPWLVDTRSFVVEEFFADVRGVDLWLGQGALGTYYSAYFATATYYGMAGDSESRQAVEVAILHYILKIGAVGAISYTAAAVWASYRTIFRRHDRFSWSVGVWVALLTLITFLGFENSFDAQHVMYWMLIGYGITQQVDGGKSLATRPWRVRSSSR
jgi:hypothetical protein